MANRPHRERSLSELVMALRAGDVVNHHRPSSLTGTVSPPTLRSSTQGSPLRREAGTPHATRLIPFDLDPIMNTPLTEFSTRPSPSPSLAPRSEHIRTSSIPWSMPPPSLTPASAAATS